MVEKARFYPYERLDMPLLAEANREVALREVVKTIRESWKTEAENIRDRLEKGTFPKKVPVGSPSELRHDTVEIPLGEKKREYLQRKFNRLNAKLKGLDDPGKTARKHIYSAVGFVVGRYEMRKAFRAKLG